MKKILDFFIVLIRSDYLKFLFSIMIIGSGLLTIVDTIKYDYGEDVFVIFLFLCMFFVTYMFYLKSEKRDIRSLIASLSIFLGLSLLLYGYGILPKHQLEIAESHYQGYESSNTEYLLKVIPNDELYKVRVDNLYRKQKIRKLELEVAQLRLEGQNEFYGFQFMHYFFFILMIIFFITYGIWQIVSLAKSEKIE